MKWFKHYSDMHDGQSINHLLDELGHTGLCFFLLQELCAEKLDPKDGNLDESDATFQFHQRIVRQKLRISGANLRRLLDVCAANGLLGYQFSGNTIQISMPILLNLLDRDTINARKTRAKSAEKSRLDKDLDKEKDKDKELEEAKASSLPVVKITTVTADKAVVHFENEQGLFEAIPRQAKENWLKLYDADYLNRELVKAWGYYQNNSRKRPKNIRGWIRALGSWFERGWPRHVAQIKSEPVTNQTNQKFWDQVFERNPS
jgi:hypothetical protein